MRRRAAAIGALALLASTGGYAAPGPAAVAFGPSARLAGPEQQTAVAVADVTGDGRADVVLAGYGETALTVLPGRGDGTFGAPVQAATLARFGSTRIRAARLDGDAAADLVVDAVSDNYETAVDVLRSDGDGRSAAPARWSRAHCSCRSESRRRPTGTGTGASTSPPLLVRWCSMVSVITP